MSSDFRYSEFAPVSRKKRKANVCPKPSPSDQVLQILDNLRLHESKWLDRSLSVLSDALDAVSCRSPALICLGLGNLASDISRAQLALLLAISDSFKLERSNISIYDPVFTQEDAETLTAFGFHVLTENKSGHYPVEHQPTLFYLPHCDLDLYENILTANWSQDSLSKTVLLCNVFGDYADNNPSSMLEKKAPRVLRIVPLLSCEAMLPCTTWPSAFNNLAIQYVLNLSGFQQLPPITGHGDDDATCAPPQ